MALEIVNQDPDGDSFEGSDASETQIENETENMFVRATLDNNDKERNVANRLDGQHRLEMIRDLDNQYKHLIDKYEALLLLHQGGQVKEEHPELSIQEELQMSGQFENINRFNNMNNEEENNNIANMEETNFLMVNEKQNKPFFGRLSANSMTKTEEFSEAETYSSGFSEGMDFKSSHKMTQTDEDCTLERTLHKEYKDKIISKDKKFVDSQFQTTPDYKLIFKEIFCVLKKAQESNSPTKSTESADGHKIKNVSLNIGSEDHVDCGVSFCPTGVDKVSNLEESYATVLRKGIQPSRE